MTGPDGYPLALRGKAGKAIGTATITSLKDQPRIEDINKGLAKSPDD